ncbi:MAG: nucleotide sugar dehydrogenase [Chitinophagales bacterium]|nr:nucleotide sugar dehydrogenase [Chitinophagales bacterium]MDW8273065.1 nucleotide sugar dehydrogenase [Chitinophagales bacterium]
MQKIAVVGVGRLGLCFALNLERAGYEVLGIDIHEEYVVQLNQKTFISPEPLVSDMLAQAKHFSATTRLQEGLSDDIGLMFIMVATPSLPDGSYDHSQIERVAGALINFGRRKQTTHIAIGCTVMPGYTATLQNKLLQYGYTVSYNPEFIAQGNIIRGQQYPDQILIGEANAEAGDLLEEVNLRICLNRPAVLRMDPLSAEIAKLATNCFLTTKISFANSIGDLAVKAGANPEKILAAIGADSRIGNKYLQYGDGFGGPCFPRDNRALSIFARHHQVELPLSDATDKVNRLHLAFQLEQLLAQNRETYFFDYITYKPDAPIIEESQRLALALALAKAGKKVVIREQPEIVALLQREYPGLFILEERK